jgi:hypothetical protein
MPQNVRQRHFCRPPPSTFTYCTLLDTKLWMTLTGKLILSFLTSSTCSPPFFLHLSRCLSSFASPLMSENRCLLTVRRPRLGMSSVCPHRLLASPLMPLLAPLLHLREVPPFLRVALRARPSSRTSRISERDTPPSLSPSLSRISELLM